MIRVQNADPFGLAHTVIFEIFCVSFSIRKRLPLIMDINAAVKPKMPGITLAPLAILPVWIGLVWSSLQIHYLDLNLGHDICGPWGCGPPLEALIGFHGFWSALILPAACLLGLYLNSATNRKVGMAVLLVGLVGIVTFVGWDVVNYYRQSETTEHLVQRALFTLVNTVDFPMIQTLLAGGILAFLFGRKKSESISNVPFAAE